MRIEGEFLYKGMPTDRPRLVESFSAVYQELTKAGPDLGMFQTRVGTGKFNRSKITIHVQGYGCTTSATAEGIKKVIRRLRPQERERIETIDAEIHRLQRERQTIVKEAWVKAHVVTVSEVKAIADAFQAGRTK